MNSGSRKARRFSLEGRTGLHDGATSLRQGDFANEAVRPFRVDSEQGKDLDAVVVGEADGRLVNQLGKAFAVRSFDHLVGVEAIEFDGHASPILCVQFRPNAIAFDGNLILREASGKTLLRKLPGDRNRRIHEEFHIFE